MNAMLVLWVLAAVPEEEAEVVVEPPARSIWSGPQQGVRFGFGPMGTLNVLAHSDLAGVTVGGHVDLSLTVGRLQGRLSALATAFAGWDGDAGFGHLLTVAAELSVRVSLWRGLGAGVGVMPGYSTGEAQNCTVSLNVYPGLGGGGGSYCTPRVKYDYAFVAPVIYPVVATLGADGQHEIAVQLSWPLALNGSYTFPSVMVRYTRQL